MPLKPMTRATNNVLRQCRARLKAHYGDRLAAVVLYGSEARGEATPDSDIDLLVLLHGPFERLKELRAIVDVLYPLQLESNRLLSARPAAVKDYERGSLQLYRNAKRDGIAV